MASARPAGWRMPSPKQMEKLARQAARQPDRGKPEPGPGDPLPEELWHAVLADPCAAGRPPLPIQQCILCFRIVEIQKADAVRFYGPHAVWKDVGQRLLDQTCSNRTGRHEEDGCWPGWSA